MDKKWNLQDIKPAGTMRGHSVVRDRSDDAAHINVRSSQQEYPQNEITNSEPAESIHIENNNKKKRHSSLVIFLIIFGIVGAGFISSYMMRGAEVTVYPRFFEPNLNATFTAYKEAPAGELTYEIMTLDASGERQVTASGQQEVNEQAKGKVNIYKSTPGTQRLIKNTRLADPSGKVFRITESVVVPGSVDGKPGSIMADVFADEAGEAYNLNAKTKFTVPGLESDSALYNAIYAENDEAFVGGFSGKKFIIDEEQLATAKQSLQLELRNSLLERLPSEQPANMTTFISSVSFTFESLPSVAYGDNLATIKERALLHIPLFKKEEFAKYIAAATVPNYDGVPVKIADTGVLGFTYTIATTSSTNLANLDSFEFKLDGRPTIVSVYDSGKLSTDLLGTQKSGLNTVLASHPAIERADVIVRPFWKGSFPKSLSDITITEVIAKKSTPNP